MIRARKKKRKKKPVEQSAKYSVDGSTCGHASSECYLLHPELKPTKPKGEAAVAAVEPEVEDGPALELGAFGFMNESSGFALMQRGHEDYKAEDGHDRSGESGATTEDEIPIAEAIPVPIPGAKSNKFYAVAVGHQVGIFLDWKTAKRAHEGYPGHKVKRFRNTCG